MFAYSFTTLLGWNPINLVDGEGYWAAPVAISCLIASLLTTILYTVKNRLLSQLETKPSSYKQIAKMVISSLYTPCLALIWYITSIFSINVLSDNFLVDLLMVPSSVCIKTGLIVIISWTLFRLKSGFFTLIHKKALYRSSTLDAATWGVLSKISSLLILLFSLILLHDIIGINMTTLLAFGGVGGLAVAFASQDMIANLFSGLMIHVTRSFSVGEEISVPSSQIDGRVEEIGWYQTTVRSSADTTRLYIPNAIFSKALVVNKSRSTSKLLQETLYVKLEGLALKNFLKAIESHLRILPKLDASARLSVWIITLYGPSAKIGLHASFVETDTNAFLKLRDEVLLAINDLAKKYDGSLIPSPENTDGWLAVGRTIST